jgi:predicted sulfurtransferase
MGTIIIFYKYVHIEYPKQVLKWQKKICQELGLKGRTFLAHEGINATLGGTTDNIERYKKIMDEHTLFAGIDYKESSGNADCFPRLYVVVRNEIVHLGIAPDKLTVQHSGVRLKPEQVHKLIESKPDNLVILDMRNNYEWRIGKFEGAITPPIENFRELPGYIDTHLDDFKDKQVLAYCTSGIRCERATAYLNQKQVAQKVYHIEGGIQRYVEQYPDGYFRGKNYVFDDRIAVKINDDILSTCDLCPAACNDYANCLNAECNAHYIACGNCLNTYANCCSQRCTDLIASQQVKRRPDRPKVDPALCMIEKR